VKTLHYISLCYGALKQYDAAAKTSLQALALHEAVKGTGHPDTITHLLSAADAIDAAGDKIGAEKLYKQALATARAATDPSNVRLAECNLELAQFYKKLDRKDEAEQYFKKALVHYEELNKKDKRSLYDLPLAYSQLLRELKRDEESDRLAHKYLNIYAPGP
jgi:tetratricopeptide (TPR) repeat protein